MRRPVKGGMKSFGNDLTKGKQVEFYFRRNFPLTKAAFDELASQSELTIKEHRKGFRWFFVSVQLTVFGGLYQTKFTRVEDEDTKWEKQWLSTQVISQVKKVRPQLRRLLDKLIPIHLQSRPARMLRYRVVFLKNIRGQKK